MRIFIFLIAALLPMAAVAGTVDRSETEGKPTATAAANPLILREKPAADAAAVASIPPLVMVEILERSGPETKTDGKPDHWVRVAGNCANDDCSRMFAGWVLDSQLGYDGRFKPLTQWRAEVVAGYDFKTVFAYDIAADGTFTRLNTLCGPGDCAAGGKTATPDCGTVAKPRDGICVISGQLYRYGDLIAGKDAEGDWHSFPLVVDKDGGLCVAEGWNARDERICSRTGRFAGPGSDPKAAMAAVMKMRRQDIALAAGDMLKLRAKPSADAEIVSRAPRGSFMVVVDRDGPAIAIGGQPDRWVKVRIGDCAAFWNSLCDPGAVGWVVDGFLAFSDRLKPLGKWRDGSIMAYAGDYGFTYSFAADGRTAYSEVCGDDYTDPEICEQKGRLYRYRDLVVARYDSGGTDEFYIDDKGNLCVPPDVNEDFAYESGTGRETRCDR